MIHDRNPLLRILLTRCFYCLLYLTLHFTLDFLKIANPWRSVKVPWRVPWRGKSGFSFPAVREGPWRFREAFREGVRGLGKTCSSPIPNWLPRIPIEPIELVANYRKYHIQRESERHMYTSCSWGPILSSGVCPWILLVQPGLWEIYPNAVKLREAFREAFTLTLGCNWCGV